jgi:hypothetical protein
LTKKPSRSGKTKKPGPSTKGASGEPPKAEAKGSAPSPPGLTGAEAKTAAEGFAPPSAPISRPIPAKRLGARAFDDNHLVSDGVDLVVSRQEIEA